MKVDSLGRFNLFRLAGGFYGCGGSQRLSACELCAKAFSCGNKLKMHMKAPAGDLFNLCLGKSRTVCVSQLCIIRCVFKLLTQEEA